MHNRYAYIELGQESIPENLVGILNSSQTFGEEGKSINPLTAGNIKIQLGNLPEIVNLKKVLKTNLTHDNNLASIYNSCNLWSFNLAIGIVDLDSFRHVSLLGIEIEFEDILSTVDLYPTTKFVEYINGKSVFSCGINIKGELGIPSKISEVISNLDENLAADASIKLVNDTKFGLNLSFSVCASSIISTGFASDRLEWIFKDFGNNLQGDQLFGATIVTHNRKKRLKYKARIYTVIKTLGVFPLRLTSPWYEYECGLPF